LNGIGTSFQHYLFLAPQHRLYFLPDPHGQGAFNPGTSGLGLAGAKEFFLLDRKESTSE
jgi:hypothetical protein